MEDFKKWKEGKHVKNGFPIRDRDRERKNQDHSKARGLAGAYTADEAYWEVK